MSWIDYYVYTIILWIIVLILTLIPKKTRFFSFSLMFATGIFFLGLKFIEGVITPNNVQYQENKKLSFIEASKIYEELSLNITPSSWLTHLDGRGKNSLIPFEYRKKIGGYLPLGSAPNVTTFSCSEDEGFISYKTDRYGFRNSDDLWNNKLHDLLIIGDSFAESSCVNKTIQEYFDPSLKIISIGKGGNGPLISLAALSEYLEVYSPKIIYHLIVENDYSRPLNHRNNLDIDLEREWNDIQLQKYLQNPNYSIGYFDYLDLSFLKNFSINFSNELININSYDKSDFVTKIANTFSYKLIKKIALSESSIFKLSEIITSKMRFIEKSKLIKVYEAMIKKANQRNI